MHFLEQLMKQLYKGELSCSICEIPLSPDTSFDDIHMDRNFQVYCDCCKGFLGISNHDHSHQNQRKAS